MGNHHWSFQKSWNSDKRWDKIRTNYIHPVSVKISVIKTVRLKTEKGSFFYSFSICLLFLFLSFSVSSKLCPKPFQKFSWFWIRYEMCCMFKSVFQVIKMSQVTCFSIKFFYWNFDFALHLQFNPLFVEEGLSLSNRRSHSVDISWKNIPSY